MSASWGVERAEVKTNELLENLPALCFIIPKTFQKSIVDCVDSIINIRRQNLVIEGSGITLLEKQIDDLFYRGLEPTFPTLKCVNNIF